mmetsp:Transcript_4714/g.8182  ORF Transcript_4714/g.8182 Transcript_4714/m.8182 type:complete len:144 (-) Transcript_4714:732-1163(-)
MKLSVLAIACTLVASVSAFTPPAANSVGHVRNAPVSSTMRMMSSTPPADFVKTEIESNDVVVFSKSFCPFCRKTKKLMQKLEIDAAVFELDKMDNGSDIQDALKEMTGQSTVPNVFVKGEHLGGNDDTQKAAKAGKLQEMLGI